MFFKGYPSITLCRFSNRCHSSSIPFCLQKWSSIGKNGQNFVGCQFGFIQIGSIKLRRIHQITKGFQYSIQYLFIKCRKCVIWLPERNYSVHMTIWEWFVPFWLGTKEHSKNILICTGQIGLKYSRHSFSSSTQMPMEGKCQKLQRFSLWIN